MILPITSAPGVQRDGTLFDGKAFAEANWCRFYRGRPRKMPGYNALRNDLPQVGRGMHIDTVERLAYTHIGTPSYLQRFTFDVRNNTSTGFLNRTPAGFVADTRNLWQFDSAFDTGTSKNYVLAHAAPNGRFIANDIDRPVYYGDLTGTAALTAISSSSVSGGIVMLHPYLIVFGSSGYLGWSVPGQPTDLTGVGSGAARVVSHKIVRGMPLRAGPGNAPAGLFWGLESLSRLMFVGTSSGTFSYDTISTSTSVLSAASIIEHNGVYYWPSNGGFLMFNGVLQPVDNKYNKAWFYKNINQGAAQHTFATKIPMWDEIWWCFPKGDSEECNHAVVFNYVDKFWYDTPLPDGGRSAANFQQVYPYLVMVDAAAGEYGYPVWQHEVGTDKVQSGQSLAIRSSFRTNQLSLLNAQPPQTTALSIQVVEPDFNQSGDLTMRVYGAPNAKLQPPSLLAEATVIEPNNGTINEMAEVNVTQRLVQFEFESNVAGGNYEMGNVLAQVEEGDDRRVV